MTGRWTEENLPEEILKLLDTSVARQYYGRFLLAKILNTYDILPGLAKQYCKHCGREIIRNPLLTFDERVYQWVHGDTGKIPCFRRETAHAATPRETELQPDGS